MEAVRRPMQEVMGGLVLGDGRKVVKHVNSLEEF